MAGAGRRIFQPGEVLTASNTMNYLMDQAVQVFAGTAARGSAIGTAVSEGMVSYRKDTHNLEAYTGSSWDQVSLTKNTGLVPMIAPTVNFSGGTATANSLGVISFTSVTSLQLNNVFNATYRNYRIVLNYNSSATNTLRFRMVTSGTPYTATNYGWGGQWGNSSGSSSVYSGSGFDWGFIADTQASNVNLIVSDISSPFETQTSHVFTTQSVWNGAFLGGYHGNMINAGVSWDGMIIYPTAGNITGTIQVYGYGPVS